MTQHMGPMAAKAVVMIGQMPWHVQYFTFHVAPVNPWEILANARAHLADQIMEVGDVTAWWDMGQIQDELLEDVCAPK